jgi:pyruvate dehydrogenase E1 component beta subunit
VSKTAVSYGEAICKGFEYLLSNYPEVVVIGQGLWSPWYVGNSMTNLDQKFGKERIIDTPVSEAACTGAGIGAGLAGMKAIVVHPRMDFMVLATDPIVNQAAKWSHMLGGQASPSVVFRGIVNRGGEQGAQHSQALHSWYAHIPGLRVVMPYSVADARDLLIAATLCGNPVVYIDDRWLYEQTAELMPPEEMNLAEEGPRLVREGKDVTLVGAGYTTHLAMMAAEALVKEGISAEVVDLRVLNPLNPKPILSSVSKTGRLVAIDGSWKTCGLAGEVLALTVEGLQPTQLLSRPRRITLPDAPAPTSKALEAIYYPQTEHILGVVREVMRDEPRARAASREAFNHC